MTQPAARSRVVAIGVATRDVIASIRSWVAPDGRALAEDIVEGGGGNAATAAVALARLGEAVSFVGRIGDDEAGEQIRVGFEREGVEISGLRRVKGERSPASVILVNRETAERSIVTFQSVCRAIDLDEEELARCAAADWIHVDQAGYAAVAGIRRAGIRTPVSLDAGNPVPNLDLGLVDLYAPTESRLLGTMGREDLTAAMRAALEAGPRMVVVTRGAQGSLAAVRDGEIRFVAAAACRAPEIVSTLGAGDVFHGALLAGLVQGLALEEALRFANAAAALSCRGLDGRSAIPTKSELEAFLGLS
jgi:sugar/nucleoside kinase (ribokinase family)